MQAAAADKLYSAVDLMEIAVKAGSIISVAYDDRLPLPNWLTSQFKPTDLSLSIDGQTDESVPAPRDNEESLTLGSNAEKTDIKACNMFIVFVGPVPKSR